MIFGAQTNAQACAGQVRHPHAGHGRVTGGHGLTVRVQALNVADERLKHAQTLGARHAYGSGGGAGGKPQGTHGAGCHRTALVLELRGREWMKVRAAAASRLCTGLMRDESICVSAKPLSQRMGSGTFSSMTEPSRVVVSSPSSPTFRWMGSPALREASAARRAG